MRKASIILLPGFIDKLNGFIQSPCMATWRPVAEFWGGNIKKLISHGKSSPIPLLACQQMVNGWGWSCERCEGCRFDMGIVSKRGYYESRWCRIEALKHCKTIAERLSHALMVVGFIDNSVVELDIVLRQKNHV